MAVYLSKMAATMVGPTRVDAAGDNQDSRFIDNAISLSAHEHIYIQTVLTKGTG